MLKRILFIGWYPNPQDEYKNVFFQNLVFSMADKGIDCTVISPVSVLKYRTGIWHIPRNLEQITPSGSIVHVYYPRCLSASSIQIGKFNTEKISEAFFELASLRQAKKLKQRFDAVYGHFFLYGGFAAIRIGKKLGIPSFLAYGECDFETQVLQTYGIPKKEQLDGLAGIVSVSKKNTFELEKLGIVRGLPILTAPNATNLELFYPKDKLKCREQLCIPKDIFVVGFVGGFIERKGDKRLLAAVEGLENVYVAFAGRGDDPPRGKRVIFCKALKHEDVCTFLNAIDVFCLPTLSEGSCNAVVEALACGKPVISSDLPFNDDALDKSNSIRINPNSVQEIRHAIEHLYINREEMYMLGIAALESSKRFSITDRAERIIKFIDECIEGL